MDEIIVEGGTPLRGEVVIGGAKNAVLPMMAACLLVPGPVRIRNVPRLRDVATFLDLLHALGVRGGYENHSLVLDASRVASCEAPYAHVKKMRASIYVLGPLLARLGQARVSMPGGCAWGPRPVNLHQDAMQALGAQLALEHGYIVARADRLRGAKIVFDVCSVGATGNAMMAAALAEGTTEIENAAAEPEIAALAEFLNGLGARIRGAGGKTITIEGVTALQQAEPFVNIPDRIEAGTFLVAGAITGGDVVARGVRPDHLAMVLSRLERMGCELTTGADSVRVRVGKGGLQGTAIVTEPYPGFPTDLQAQFMALLCLARGTGVITETIYPDRFTHVPELRRLGAEITLSGNVATVTGVERLQGASVMSTDIRASSALILGGLAAAGWTRVSRVYHIDRGYERIEEKLQGLGARIRRVREGET
ncbi:MAG: UDP-N-acetylglucosamine 1-carboxyvinyltransferase [Candidatus Eisenbacteria bacterium]|uniref:UDP-N-acetylglucosamine 1-carboxyvinyltransferase n=1 Tax=Eiseniibacteriota bacterium TaxID=2212470 RepID=A0A938BRH8_UNCEI|nr:UDP-N-acetylglucosamine 1-carboxyvinyltransferase [Candidatus Eisenbacteria bacterium]